MGRWHNLPVVVLARQVGGRSVFKTGNPVHQMVPLIHQAANTFPLSAHMKLYLGCKVSCAVTGNVLVGTGMAMQLSKSGAPDAANQLQIHSVSNLADWM